jgi:hypothetical protein
MSQLQDNNSFGGILTKLKVARQRWETLGYKINNTRVEFYESVISRLIELGPEGIMREYKPDEANKTYLIFAEIHEYLFVSETICDRPHLLEHPRLKEIFSGQPTAELEKNPMARNTLFELLIAAVLDRAGLLADVAHRADVETEVDDSRLCIECKRPQGFEGLENCMRDAEKQLRTRLPQVGENAIGIVALSFSKAITHGTHRLEAPSVDHMHATMLEVMKRVALLVFPFWKKHGSHSAVFINVCVAGTTKIPFVNSQFTLLPRPELDPAKNSVLRNLQAALEKVKL